MIRINLLQGPRGRKGKGQWDVQMEAAAAGVAVVLTIALCLFYSTLLGREVDAIQTQMQEKRKQIADLKLQVKKVEDFERKKALLQKQNKVIEQLEKRRGGPVKILDLVSGSLEPLKLWIVTLKKTGQQVDLKGVALENDDVVGFVNNLRRGDLFKSINLVEIRAKQQSKVKVFHFTLRMQLKG